MSSPPRDYVLSVAQGAWSLFMEWGPEILVTPIPCFCFIFSHKMILCHEIVFQKIKYVFSMILGYCWPLKYNFRLGVGVKDDYSKRERSKYIKFVMLKNCAETGSGMRESKD